MEQRKKIAIVDDDPEVRDILRTSLELEGYEALTASNGIRLVSTLYVDCPDLILLDVMMSWIDGFELCRMIKDNKEFRHIPVIFISAHKSDEDIASGLSSGGDDYFPKPLEMERLLPRVREMLS